MAQMRLRPGGGWRAVGALAGAVVILGLPPALAARSLAGVLFTPAQLSESLNSSLVESGLATGWVVRALVSAGQEGGDQGVMMPTLAVVDEATRRGVLEMLLPDYWMEAQIERLVGQTFEWMATGGSSIELSLDLQLIKSHLMGEAGRQVAIRLLAGLPGCDLEQLHQLEAALTAGGWPPALRCDPPEPLHSQFLEASVAELQAVARQLPDQLVLDDGQNPAPLDEMDDARQALLRFRRLLTWSWLLPASLLGVVVAAAVRTPEDGLRWWGTILLMASALSLLTGMVFPGLLVRAVAPGLGGLPADAEAGALARSIVEGLGSAAGRREAASSVLLALAATGMLIGGRFVRGRQAMG
jgi:hypothetical protein